MAGYNDPVKQISRIKLREFIARTLLSCKSAKNIRVVCFPGAEQEGEEALEVREIYDVFLITRLPEKILRVASKIVCVDIDRGYLRINPEKMSQRDFRRL